MCGIAGISFEHRETIERMVRALAHRGPDGNAVCTGHGAALGHARLAILDPRPEGDQPMWNDDRTIAIVYNGEIFNFRDLREEERMTCRTNTDTEVILRLFERYGMDFISRLRGMFAFGIFETKTGTWHLARDHKGIKPLFVATRNGKLLFASEMRSLMAAMPEKPSLDLRSLSLYLRLQYVPGPATMCQGIEQLPPGTVLTWRNGKAEHRTFAPRESFQWASRAAFRSGFPDVMDGVVRRHLVSDRPLGVFLSGGMDSSVVLHHMCRNVDKPVQTFTVRFDATEEEGAERFNADADLARRTAEHYGTDHREIFLTAADFRDLYAATARALDQPNADTVSVAQFLLSREAKKHVDVVLTGAGGDELFGGYPRYRIARVLRALRFVPPLLRATLGRAKGFPPDVMAMQPGPLLVERLLARPAAEGEAIARGEWFDPAATTTLFQARFAALSSLDPLRAFMEFDRGLWLIDESLRLADATTMGSGLEARVPFVDETVIAASHATPAAWHVGFSRTKALLKDTYRSILPDHLFTLPKASFYPPLAKWLRREASPLAEAMLEHPRIKEYFDTTLVRRQFEEHRAHRAYHLHTLQALIQLAHWFDAVYDA